MKKKLQKRWYLPLLLALGISSCSKDVDSPKAIESNQEQSYEFNLSLEGDGDETDLAQTARSIEGARALKLEADPSAPGKYRIAEGSGWNAHVFVKNKNNGRLGYVEYQFAFAGRSGSRKVLIKNVTSAVTLTMLDGGAAPTLSEVQAGHWLVSGILGGGTRSGATITFDSSNRLNLSPDQVEAPLVSDWKVLQATSNGNTYYASFTMKPQGVIAQVGLTNNTGIDKTAPFYAGWLISDGGNLYSKATYDFSTASVTSIPKYSVNTASENLFSGVLKHPAMQAGEKKNHFVWFALDPNATSYKFEVQPTGYYIYKGKTYPGRKEQLKYDSSTAPADQRIADGKRINLTLIMDKPAQQPVELVSNYVLAGGSTQWHPQSSPTPETVSPGMYGALRAEPTTSDNNRVGEYASHYYPGSPINVEFPASSLSSTYRLPDIYDYLGLFPHVVNFIESNENMTYDLFRFIYPGMGFAGLFDGKMEMSQPIPDPDPSNPDGVVVYSIRFKPTNTPTNGDDYWSGGRMIGLLDNSHLSAYRIRRIGKLSATHDWRNPYTDPLRDRIVVDVVHLGDARANTTLAEISDPAWWAANASQIIHRESPSTQYHSSSWNGSELAVVSYRAFNTTMSRVGVQYAATLDGRYDENEPSAIMLMLKN